MAWGCGGDSTIHKHNNNKDNLLKKRKNIVQEIFFFAMTPTAHRDT